MSSERVAVSMRAIRARALLCSAVLAAVLSASCVESPPAGPISTLIPSEAIAAVVVESPYKLFKAVDEFWKSAGLAATLGSELQGLLEKSVPNSGKAAEVLDFARPWALAVLPAGGGSADAGPKKTRILLYVPFRTAPEDLMGKLAGSMKVVAKAKGYVVLSDAEGQLSFPPAKGADLSRLTRYSASSIKLWGDPAAIRKATADGYKPIADAARNFVTEPPAAASAKGGVDPAASSKAIGELGLSLLAQLGLADASLELGAAGLTLRVAAASAKGSELQKTLVTASAAPSALDWAGQVDGNAMYGFAWSLDPSLTAGFYQRFMGSLYSGLGLPGDILTKASALQAKWSKAGGPRGAMSLDIGIDAAAIAGAKNLKDEDAAAVADFIKKAISIKFDMFQDIKDEAAYRALLRGFASDPDYLAFMKAYTEAFGLSLSFKSQEKKDGAFSYGEFGMKLQVVDGGKLDSLGGGSSSKASVEAMLAVLESMISARWTMAGGRFMTTSGDLAALKALAARKAAPASLASDPAFAAFAKTMPPKTIAIGALSIKKLMSMVDSILSASNAGGAQASMLSMLDPSIYGSWYSYVAIDARNAVPGLESGFLIPASDIGAMVKLGLSLGKGKAQGAGGV